MATLVSIVRQSYSTDLCFQTKSAEINYNSKKITSIQCKIISLSICTFCRVVYCLFIKQQTQMRNTYTINVNSLVKWDLVVDQLNGFSNKNNQLHKKNMNEKYVYLNCNFLRFTFLSLDYGEHFHYICYKKITNTQFTILVWGL